MKPAPIPGPAPQLLLAAAALAAFAGAAHPARAQPARETLEEIVVSAARRPQQRLEVAGSIDRIGAAEIELRGATHAAEILNTVPGVMVQRGSGQESLTAIRSPVLSGPGACGAFLVLEDGMPIRPVGTCNVNELFEVNTEQAGAIEVIRGPAATSYGANAVHGLVNVLTPAVAALDPWRLALEAGPDDFARAAFAVAEPELGLGAYGVVTHDAGFRDHSTSDEDKLNLLSDRSLAGGQLRLRVAATSLRQETAGFIRGLDAYRDPLLRRSNANPEAFRNAWSGRASAAWTRSDCAGCSDRWQLALRRSGMEFLQHFLLGKPLERNDQGSIAWSGARERPFGTAGHWRVGADLEFAAATLLEIQDGPTLEGSAAARAIRPAGRHYDYDVRALTLGVHAGFEWPLAARLRLAAAMRADRTQYRYDNRMLDGNTAEDGTPCSLGGCLSSRPADRSDRFDNLTPRLELAWAPGERQRLYLAATRGFRPPESTELYRLQRQQRLADLDSERATSLEAGWRGSTARLAWSLALFDMHKRHVILRDANGFNVSDGRTGHRGVEYEFALDAAPGWRLLASGSIARHRYEFSRAIDGGETITSGDDVDTAPRELHRLALDWNRGGRLRAGAELQYVGPYFADAANQHRYPGHAVAGANVAWKIGSRLTTTLRVTNLLDRAYADRADFAQGDWRYFPARGRAAFLEFALRRAGDP